jgi:hypothetical protein
MNLTITSGREEVENNLFSTSSRPEVIVKFIFVPVSPSGTGYTLRESTKSALLDKLIIYLKVLVN